MSGKNGFVYSLLIVIIISTLLFSFVSCGGSDTIAVIDSGAENTENTENTGSDGKGSLSVTVKWPESNDEKLAASVLYPELTVIDIVITGAGLSTPIETTIERPESTKVIENIPEGPKEAEFTGRNSSNEVISHRIVDINIIRNTVNKLDHPVRLGVSILDSGFYPDKIPVTAGDTLVWVNNDTVAHTVTDTGSPPAFDSGEILPGGEFSYTFNEPNTVFTYNCTSSDFTGTVPVVNPWKEVVDFQAISSTYSLLDIHFTDENNGWAVGFNYTGSYDALVLHTGDGGINWSEQTIPGSINILNATYFADENTGWAAGVAFSSPDNGYIIKTTNGGR